MKYDYFGEFQGSLFGDIDELLHSLNEEELAELSLVDPDVSF